jgi:hypothetical protein
LTVRDSRMPSPSTLSTLCLHHADLPSFVSCDHATILLTCPQQPESLSPPSLPPETLPAYLQHISLASVFRPSFPTRFLFQASFVIYT